MSLIGSMFGHLPGMGSVVETFEQAYCWGPYPRYYTGAYIDSTAADPTNTPTWELRMGLVMGLITATGTWKQYSPTATDGSEVAQGVLPIALRMQDVVTGVNTAKFYGIMVSGGVQGSKLIGLDLMARSQMNAFIFDDNLAGNHIFPWRRFQTKTANYTIVASDNLSNFDNLGALAEVDFTLPAIANGYDFGFRALANFTLKVISAEGTNIVAGDNLSHFDNLGASTEVDFTLPAIANGYEFGFTALAAQILKVISAEGTNIVALNNASATSVAFQTGAGIIGGGFRIYSNPAGTKWVVENTSAGSNTITVA